MPYPMTRARYLASGYASSRPGKLVFHARECWYASRLKRPPRMYLARDDAVRDGCRACLVCKP